MEQEKYKYVAYSSSEKSLPKRIICPTDFSMTALNAIEYAAKLCQRFHMDLLLSSLESYYPFEVMVTGVSKSEKISKASEALSNMCAEVSRIFNINCTFNVEVDNSSLERVMALEAGSENMIVIGTDGIDSLYDFFFGTNSFQVARSSGCPVLIVPHGHMYGDFKRLVYIGEDEFHDRVSLTLFRELLNSYNPHCIFLLRSDLSDPDANHSDKFIVINGEAFFKSNVEVVKIEPDDVFNSLLNSGSVYDADVLVLGIRLSSHSNEFLKFGEFQKICEMSDIPILILHH